VNEKPTRNENVLDLLAINNPTLLNRLEIIPGISDHDAVFAELDISPQKHRQVRRKIPMYGKADWEKIEEDLKTTYHTVATQYDVASVDELWNSFKSELQTAIDKHIPHRMSSNRDRPPWITTRIRK
jgi:hypothetical protein